MPSRLRQLPPGGAERRATPRHLVPPDSQLVVGVAVTDGESKPMTFSGRVRDISRRGMAIILPPDDTCRELAGKSPALLVVVSLPAGVIHFSAAPVYCHVPQPGQAEPGYVFGVRSDRAASRPSRTALRSSRRVARRWRSSTLGRPGRGRRLKRRRSFAASGEKALTKTRGRGIFAAGSSCCLR